MPPFQAKFWSFLESSVAIDSDRGHFYEHLKKKSLEMKIEPVACIRMFLREMNFDLPRMAKNSVFQFSGLTCVS